MQARQIALRQHNGSLGVNYGKAKAKKNFAQANRKQLRDIERRNAERRAEEEFLRTQPRQKKYAHVESQVFKQKENKNANKTTKAFLKRSAKTVPVPTGPYVSNKTRTKASVAQIKAKPTVLHREKKDFVNRNRQKASDTTKPVQRTKKTSAPAPIHSSFGKVPKYITQRKSEMAAEAEEKRLAQEARKNKGLVKMPEDQRNQVLKAIDEKLAAANKQYSRLPLVIETPILRQKKSDLEAKISELVAAQRKFSTPNVWIKG